MNGPLFMKMKARRRVIPSRIPEHDIVLIRWEQKGLTLVESSILLGNNTVYQNARDRKLE